MPTKTLLIFQEDLSLEPEFIIVDGDYSRFNKVFCGAGNDEELETEMLEFFYGPEGTGPRQHKGAKEFPIDQQPFDHVAVCGFIP